MYAIAKNRERDRRRECYGRQRDGVERDYIVHTCAQAHTDIFEHTHTHCDT